MDGDKNGLGLYVWLDGKKYFGNWKDGKQHGPGKFAKLGDEPKNQFYKNGKIIQRLSEDEMIENNDDNGNFADLFMNGDEDSAEEEREEDLLVKVKSIEN